MAATTNGTVNTTKRLAALRQLMAQEHNVQAYVVPSEDQHSSEYLADCDKRRAFISGFSGSAGCAVITPKEAFMFTDGRYFLQAVKEMDQNWTLMKQGLQDVPTWQEFLSKNLESSTRIGIDPTLISASNADTISKALGPTQSTLVPIDQNLVDLVWGDRPARPHNSIIHLDEKYAGQSLGHKIRALREELAKKKYQAFVVNMLDEIAWLFNLRGSDIEYNPVFFAYAVITADSVNLFVEKTQLSDDALKNLGDDIKIKPYDAFFGYLRELPTVLTLDEEAKVLIGENASHAIAQALGKDKYVIAPSPIAEMKAIKNATELEGFRQSHIRDGAALARYFAWLEEQVNNGVEINESQGADKLEALRSDAWARRALWKDGLGMSYNSTPLKAGMTVSNEPGYYADGRFGIRIESIVLVRDATTPNNFGDKGYLGFEVVTMCPISKKLIDTSLLTADEQKWLDAYHAQTWEKVSPLLENDERALKWLERETSPL
ncbi:hypothetical protein C0992_008203 [Termitomyces sp. T32_za158]|nr:hypothetical protein C0992_008203 [Termitomyces sp. T32_za158]